MPRIFFALPVEPNIQWQSLFDDCKKHFNSEHINWVSINGIHITLFFFGETENTVVRQIIQQAEKQALKFNGFELKLQKPLLFGSTSKPNVIGWQFNTNSTLIEIKEFINQVVSETGFKTEERAFVPHVTLGRVKKVFDKKTFEGFVKWETPKIAVHINKLVLFKSDLTPTGAVYTPMWEIS